MMTTPIEKSAQSKRSRIVVTLDDPQAKGGARVKGRAGRSGGGAGKSILLIFLVLFAFVVLGIIAAGYFWWQSYKSGPNYSLALVVDAAQRNDTTTLDAMVDTDKIVDNFVPQVVEKAGAQTPAGLGGPMRKQLQSLVLKYAPQVKQRVREEVAGQIKELSARAEHKPFFLVALALPFVVDTKQEGDAATVKATLKDRPIELNMQRDGEHWKIVGLKDDVLATRILENVTRDLPTNNAPQVPDELRRQLEKKLPGKLPDIPILTK
jgi:hypothetical protein